MNYLAAFREIKGFIFDVDGVLTNAQVLVQEDGSLLRNMSIRDGYALKVAVEQGYFVGIITGGKSEGVVKRLQNLGINAVYSGVKNKKVVLEELIDLYDLKLADLAYMGDDIPDLVPMRLVGVPFCPQNACPEIREISRYISPINGGEGCVRDVIEKTLKIAGSWPGQKTSLSNSPTT